MYKYNCRKCPIRNRCIDESVNAPTVKEIVRHAFAARTDTLETWGLLQPGCLLIKAEEERASTTPRESLLSRRLREARQAREQVADLGAMSDSDQPDYLRPVTSLPFDTRLPAGEAGPSYADVRSSEQEAPPLAGTPAPQGSAPRWLTVVASGRHIVLPTVSPLVLGRFDPHFWIPPDVDLTFEDQRAHTVSRQHAKIVGVAGGHTVEDLGSQHGLFVNGVPVKSGPHLLQLGDRIKLGSIQLLYEAVPGHLQHLPPHTNARHLLIVTPTGRKYSIAPPDDILIGRSDPFINFVPDIDLGREGNVSMRVSRRHAIITWRNNLPCVEDLGSGFGTRLNGETLLIGQAVPLKPGDHIWLGGCVLAYDVEL